MFMSVVSDLKWIKIIVLEGNLIEYIFEPFAVDFLVMLLFFLRYFLFKLNFHLFRKQSKKLSVYYIFHSEKVRGLGISDDCFDSSDVKELSDSRQIFDIDWKWEKIITIVLSFVFAEICLDVDEMRV